MILFPFLFAIMFGDVGHGALLVLLALVFIIFEEKLLKTKVHMPGARLQCPPPRLQPSTTSSSLTQQPHPALIL